jgi:hypothetical protein
MTITYTNSFNSKVLQNVPKLGFLVLKYRYHLATIDGLCNGIVSAYGDWTYMGREIESRQSIGW